MSMLSTKRRKKNRLGKKYKRNDRITIHLQEKQHQKKKKKI